MATDKNGKAENASAGSGAAPCSATALVTFPDGRMMAMETIPTNIRKTPGLVMLKGVLKWGIPAKFPNGKDKP